MVEKDLNKFAARLIAFKGDDSTEDHTLVEVVDFNGSSEVEIAFGHRDKRLYLKFSLASLIAHVAAHAKPVKE